MKNTGFRRRFVWATVLAAVITLNMVLSTCRNSNEAEQSLITGIVAADAEQIESAILRGANVNKFLCVSEQRTLHERLKQLVHGEIAEAIQSAKCDELAPALILGVQRQSPAVVETLLRHGADPNCRDRDGRTPLLEAYANTRIAKRLIDAGADVNAADKWGSTALMLAAQAGRFSTVVALLNRGADPDMTDMQGRNALHYSIMACDPKTLEVLLNAGVSSTALDRTGDSALSLLRRSPWSLDRRGKAVEALLSTGSLKKSIR